MFRHSGTPAVGCSYKAAAGHLYPLERGFIFVHKPPIHIRFEELISVNFARSGGSTRYCTLNHLHNNYQQKYIHLKLWANTWPLYVFLIYKTLRLCWSKINLQLVLYGWLISKIPLLQQCSLTYSIDSKT